MNTTWNAVGQGLRRGVIELRHVLGNAQDLGSNLIWLVGLLAPIYFLRDDQLAGSDLSVATFVLPSLLSMCVGFNGLLMLAQLLVVEREDGTLLRLKALPQGMVSYLIGKIVLISGMVLVAWVVVLGTGAVLVEGLQLGEARRWLTLLWVFPLGLLAMLPIGAVIGSVIESPRSIGLVMLPVLTLAALSGIFYPISGFPTWLQVVAQVFPLYWLGLAARFALLPDSALAAEIGGSWQHWETFTALGVWAVVGLLAAPVVLRLMARRESGSTMARRRDLALDHRPA
ncbi:ABC transporter permease [Micromonospora arborensis]|uniref:ABC transporter permease n=1 Tax=Micromonospora arborensis TaxID=2116518 RepID=UPI0033F0D1EE